MKNYLIFNKITVFFHNWKEISVFSLIFWITFAWESWGCPLTVFITDGYIVSSAVIKSLFTEIKHSAARGWVTVPHLLCGFNYRRTSTQDLYKEQHAPQQCNMNSRIQINSLSVHSIQKPENLLNHLIEQWLYLGRAQTLPPTVQQQYRRTHCSFQRYDIQSHTDKPPQFPSLCCYSTAYVSEGGQGESHSQPLRAKAFTRCMKLFSLEHLQEVQSISYMLVHDPLVPETN